MSLTVASLAALRDWTPRERHHHPVLGVVLPAPAQQGKTTGSLIWDNASWHKSQAVRTGYAAQPAGQADGERRAHLAVPVAHAKVPGSILLSPNGCMPNGMSSSTTVADGSANWLNGSVPTLDVRMNLILSFPKRSRDYALGSITRTDGIQQKYAAHIWAAQGG